MMPSIIYEDNHLLAINKPAGWLVQGDRTGDRTLTDWGKTYLKEKYAKPGAVFLHPAHRIDRPVSGAVLFARTDKALGRLTSVFRNREVDKTYLALVLWAPEHTVGELRHFLLKDESRNVVQVFAMPVAGAKEAILHYAYLGKAGALHLMEIHPLTGRPHQIRAQLAAMGLPIAGDLKYGASVPLPDASIGLHSRRLVLEHPVRKTPLALTAPLPEQPIWREAALLVAG
ncbi:MAG: RluA family pseudouridine synthase [Saprospirales bacterium]|nr:RluA family pseudouridine synthase [Saprospirales bacterium]MBK8921632.1 RluA family pseudouridine synthase [Saprospirales bacterium]